MGLFDKIKKAFANDSDADPENEFQKIIKDTFREYAATHRYIWSPDLTVNTIYTEQVKSWPDKKKISFILWMVPIINKIMTGRTTWSSEDKDLQLSNVKKAYVDILFRNKLIMDDEEAINIYEAFATNKTMNISILTHWPVNLFLNQLEKQRKGQQLSVELTAMLEKMKQTLKQIANVYQEKDRIKMVDKIDAMLFAKADEPDAIKPAKFLGEDALAQFANPIIESMPDAEKLHWYNLLPLAQKASGSKPSNKYLNDTKEIIKELGVDKFKKTMHDWIQFLVDLKEAEKSFTHNVAGRVYSYVTIEYLSSVNAEAMKGLIWICSHFHDGATIKNISALAERAYKKIPGKGPTAASLGNACLYTLFKSKGLDGIGQLSRLKLRIKQASTQSLIDKYLQAAADEKGVTIEEIEDMAVDDCGMMNGSRTFVFDEYNAELVITGVGKSEINWFKPDGSPQKSIPASVKDKHAAKLKKIKDVAKQLDQTTAAQRDRIDRMFRTDRKMSMEKFEQYYLQHGIMSCLSKGIIWNFHFSNKKTSAIYLNNHWVNSNNEIVDITNADTVSLWHPVQASVHEIKTWREFFVFHQLLQPLKQAYREVYLLTDAELNTKTYSNRMAAHILRQHQFNSLAKTRGWRYSLMGAFDNGGNGGATLTLPQYELRAEYWIMEVNADGAINDVGILNYVSTDQVRFVNSITNETVDLIDIPPLVFSEVMRDVDLFVGVASVGNDPTWQDGGGLPGYRDYWTSYSFGDLSEVAKNRKEILTDLVPRLKIKEVATIKDKFLVVKGKLRTYKIHIGSTNILMEPNDQYLCIVPDRGKKDPTENLFLPFEGDNGLSIILSKAFLLADDDRIKDTTITSQINHK